MLKSELRRLHHDRHSVHKTIISHEKSSSIIERKYTIAKEMLDKATSERQKLAKTNFDLKKWLIEQANSKKLMIKRP